MKNHDGVCAAKRIGPPNSMQLGGLVLQLISFWWVFTEVRVTNFVTLIGPTPVDGSEVIERYNTSPNTSEPSKANR
jgi:hypothetical protein